MSKKKKERHHYQSMFLTISNLMMHRLHVYTLPVETQRKHMETSINPSPYFDLKSLSIAL